MGKQAAVGSQVPLDLVGCRLEIGHDDFSGGI